MSTYFAKPGEVQREWLLVDAEGMILGRLASEVANILRGKHKPQYTPNVDTGDFVVVINAEKVQLSGTKAFKKSYFKHTGFPGGLKEQKFLEAMEKCPEKVIERAVKGMLPKGTLGRAQGMKLKVYRGSEHPHTAQAPRKIELKG